MARDRIHVSNQFRSTTNQLKEKNVLDMNILEGKDIFMLAVALGLEDPTRLKNKDGLFQRTSLKTLDKALIASVLLGTAVDDSNLDEYADFDKSADLCEQCAETGYQVLLRKYNDADCDSDLLERRMIKELELLFAKNVEAGM